MTKEQTQKNIKVLSSKYLEEINMKGFRMAKEGDFDKFYKRKLNDKRTKTKENNRES